MSGVQVEYQLGVVAEDAGPYPHPALSALVVRVVDVNSHAPRITVDAAADHHDDGDVISGPRRPEVEENRPPGTFVAHVTATDADSGRNGVVSCQLTQQVLPTELFSEQNLSQSFHLKGVRTYLEVTKTTLNFGKIRKNEEEGRGKTCDNLKFAPKQINHIV